jgi:hypothetical protein
VPRQRVTCGVERDGDHDQIEMIIGH